VSFSETTPNPGIEEPVSILGRQRATVAQAFRLDVSMEMELLASF
jgi:hypothetical protein